MFDSVTWEGSKTNSENPLLTTAIMIIIIGWGIFIWGLWYFIWEYGFGLNGMIRVSIAGYSIVLIGLAIATIGSIFGRKSNT